MPRQKRAKGIKELAYFAACGAILGMSLTAYLYIDNTINKQTYEQLITRAKSIAVLIDPTDIAQLSLSEMDLSNPTYNALKKKLTALRETNEDLRFLYLMTMRDGRVYFVADSENPGSNDYSPPGQEYGEASQELIIGWNPGVPHVLEIYEDRLGNWISALAPIVNASGTTVALAGLDQNANTHQTYFLAAVALIILATIALLSLVSVLYILNRREKYLNDVKADFVAVASHELRSPLTAIRWGLAALRSDPTLQPNTRDVVNDIYLKICALIGLTSTLLLTTSAEHGVMRKGNFILFNMGQTISDAIAHAQSIALMKHIKIQSDIEPNASISTRGDADRLRLVFDNLLSNAVKYSPEGSTVSIRYIYDKSKNTFVIQDQGIGVPRDELKKIFEGFHRASNAEHSRTIGSGFGLYMAKKIVDFHEGTLVCESEVGHGTTFTITLPTGV